MLLSQTMYQPKTLFGRFKSSNFMFFLLCFLFPCFFFYLDVSTDIALAVAYYENQNMTNVVLTLFFVLLSHVALAMWTLRTHLRQPDDLRMLRRVSKPIRLVISFIIIFWFLTFWKNERLIFFWTVFFWEMPQKINLFDRHL